MPVHVLTLLRSGPGSYDLFESGLAQLSFKQAFLARTKKGGFGSTVQRDFIFHNEEMLNSPSPAQYEVRPTIGAASLPLCCHCLVFKYVFVGSGREEDGGTLQKAAHGSFQISHRASAARG